MDIDDLVYTVAVGTDPLKWAVHCEICDDIISEDFLDGPLVDKVEQYHKDFHLESGK